MANQKKIKEQTTNGSSSNELQRYELLAWRYYWLMRDAPMRYLKNYYMELSKIYSGIARDMMKGGCSHE